MEDQNDPQLVPAESDLYKDIIGYLSGIAGFDIKRYVERIEINKQREIYVDGNRINGYCSAQCHPRACPTRLVRITIVLTKNQ